MMRFIHPIPLLEKLTWLIIIYGLMDCLKNRHAVINTVNTHEKQTNETAHATKIPRPSSHHLFCSA